MKKIIDNQKTLRGIVIMIAGLGLLLHTLGIIQTGINLVLILASVAMIIYGFITSGLQQVIHKIIKEYKPLVDGSKKPSSKESNKSTDKESSSKSTNNKTK